MMKRCGILVVTLVLLLGIALPAHEGKTHIMGTVTEIGESHIVVKTREGKLVKIPFDKDTLFRRGKGEAKAADMKVGHRIVVDVTGRGDRQKASEIRLSPGGGDPKPHGTQHAPHMP